MKQRNLPAYPSWLQIFYDMLSVLICLCLSLSSLPIQAAEQEETGVSLYRVYNPNSGEHFYTQYPAERDHLVSLGWNDEGIGWVAPVSGDPVYRLYNPNAGDHHYTLNPAERDMLVRLGWNDEGIGWYSDPAQNVKVYREYNPNAKSGAHNFTANEAEDIHLGSIGWKREGVGFYALNKGNPSPASSILSPLHVEGSKLMNVQGKEVVLQGFSTFGLNYMPEYVNENVFRFLKNEMNSQIIRLALYTQESGGYCNGGNQEQLKALIDQGVSVAKKTGQYVIIDWHILSDGNPMTHFDQAKAFFDEMSGKYASQTHVLYEICNEPNGVDWNTVKNYATEIIDVIRKNDPDAMILVGTPTWSQDVDVVADDPIENVSNIMYTLHFYAATHKQSLQEKLKKAHEKGLPVFVSEFGISSADGNGQLDPESGNVWISLLNQYGISRVGWALSNKNETSALFLPGTTTDLSLNDLSPAGKWFYQTYTGKALPDAGDQDSQDPDPQKPDQPAGEDQNLSWSLAKTNSWKENNQTCTQFSLSIHNSGSQKVNGWKITLSFNQDFEVINSWNAAVQNSNEQLIIEPEEYNRTIEAGQDLNGIGFILRTDAENLEEVK